MKPNKVGYRNPPKSAQFRPGVSGNPKGRPKGSSNLATDLAAELGETVTVQEDGHRLRVSKQRALVKSLMRNALKGDVRSSAALLSLYARVITEPSADDSAPIDDEERKILRHFLPRLLKSLK